MDQETFIEAGKRPDRMGLALQAAGTAMGHRWLNFEAGLEARYRNHCLPSAVLLARMTMLVGGALFALIALVDEYGMGYRFPPPVHAALLYFNAPLSFALGFLSFVPALRKHVPLLGGVMLLTCTVVVLWCYPQVIYDTAAPPYSFEGLMVIVAFCYIVSGQRFWPSALLGVGSAVAFMLVMMNTPLTTGALTYCAFYLSAFNIIGLFGGYLREYYGRAHFLSAEEIKELAERDPLTGVFNRRVFSSRLENLVRQARREQVSLTVLVIDVDHFKDVNDGAGHHFGDQVLLAAAQALNEASRRPLDMVARLGGDEFVAIWYNLGAEHLTRACEALQQGFAHSFAPLTAKHGHRITMSVGAAHAIPATWHDGETMLKYADDALYETKSNGRNGYTIVGVDEHPVVEARSERVDEPISRNRPTIGR